jgi:hypothetical protein
MEQIFGWQKLRVAPAAGMAEQLWLEALTE